MSDSPGRLLRTGQVTAAGGLAAFAYGVLIERRWYIVRHHTVPVLRAGATRSLRVLHISDLHLLPRQRHRLDFVTACLDTAPDVLVATGDFLEDADAIAPVVETLGPAARNRTALAVLGSHDYWGPSFKHPLSYLTAPGRRVYGNRLPTSRLVEGLTAAGWQVLDNRRRRIETPAGLLDVAGFGDPHVGLDRPDAIDWTPPEDAAALRLGLVHAPYRRSLDRFRAAGFDLVLAGHTHGGQVRAPLLGALVNNCDLPLDRSRGLSRLDAGAWRPEGQFSGEGGPAEPMWLHVSAGLGHGRFAPFRFACRPEASVLDLAPAASL